MEMSRTFTTHVVDIISSACKILKRNTSKKKRNTGANCLPGTKQEQDACKNRDESCGKIKGNTNGATPEEKKKEMERGKKHIPSTPG